MIIDFSNFKQRNHMYLYNKRKTYQVWIIKTINSHKSIKECNVWMNLCMYICTYTYLDYEGDDQQEGASLHLWSDIDEALIYKAVFGQAMQKLATGNSAYLWIPITIWSLHSFFSTYIFFLFLALFDNHASLFFFVFFVFCF